MKPAKLRSQCRTGCWNNVAIPRLGATYSL